MDAPDRRVADPSLDQAADDHMNEVRKGDSLGSLVGPLNFIEPHEPAALVAEERTLFRRQHTLELVLDEPRIALDAQPHITLVALHEVGQFTDRYGLRVRAEVEEEPVERVVAEEEHGPARIDV